MTPSSPTDTIASTMTAGSDASAPNAPPVSIVDPEILGWMMPCAAPPDTAMPKIPPCAKFHAAWTPTAIHSRRVNI